MSDTVPAQEPAGEADEFADVPSPRRARSPLVALAATALAGYLLYHLRPDLSYALHPRTPQPLGDARQAAEQPPLANHYVTLSGAPDRSNAALLDTRGRDEYRQFFRLLGTGSRLLVLRTFGTIPKPRTLTDEFTGRLIAFRDLSFSEAIARWFEQRVVATHFLSPAEVQARAQAESFELADLAGDRVAVGPESHLAVDWLHPNEYRLAVPSGVFPSRENAREALVAAGWGALAEAPLPVPAAGEGEALFVGHPFEHTRAAVIEALRSLGPDLTVTPNPDDPAELYVRVRLARFPDGIAGAKRALEAKGMVGASPPPFLFFGKVSTSRRDDVLEKTRAGITVTPRTETLSGSWQEIRKSHRDRIGSGLRVKLVEPLKIPTNAQVLLEGEAPSSYWYIPIMYVLLGIFLALNLYTLWASLAGRGRRSSANAG